MKVIFIKDLKGQAKKGEIKTVKPGYGMNFLIKGGYAVLATETGMKRLQSDIQEQSETELKDIVKFKAMSKELTKVNLVFPVKTGESDRVFGSISSKKIAAELSKLGFSIDKRKIIISSPISTLGTHIVMIDLHKQIKAEIKVNLVKEG